MLRSGRLRAAIFPLAYVATTSSLTVVFICLGLLGHTALAADLAVAQGAVIATFLAFSANARNLILQRTGEVTAARLFVVRLIALLPISVLAFALGTEIAAVPAALLGIVLLRRASEWLAEVDVNVLELNGELGAAARYLLTQAIAPLVVVAAAIVAPGYLYAALLVWAISPLPLVLSRVPREQGMTRAAVVQTFRALLPHAGSTIVVGIAIFLLRLIIVVAAGRDVGGLLLTGIGIGSLAGTLFGNVIGPTLALRGAEQRPGGLRAYRAVQMFLVASGVGGVALAGQLTGLPGKPAVFWYALGFSLVGSAVMIEAQRTRLRMFEALNRDELFAADVLRSVTLLVAALAVVYFAAPAMLATAYFLDAALSWLFYRSAGAASGTPRAERVQAGLRTVVAVALVFPLFVQLQGTVFHSPEQLLDSGGVLATLPLPLGLAACFVGVLFVGHYRDATFSMGAVFALFVAMIASTAVASGGLENFDARKLLLLIQYILPAFALVLGQKFAGATTAPDAEWRRAFFVVVVAFALAQVVLTFHQGRDLITHDMVLFAIYQHRQFVPVIFVGAFLIGLLAWWRRPGRRWPLIAATVVMTVYAAHSFSTLSLALLALGLAALVLVHGWSAHARVAVGVAVAVAAIAMAALRTTHDFKSKYTLDYEARTPAVAAKVLKSDQRLPEAVAQRLDDWYLYGSGIVESWSTALFGHRSPFDRSVSTSAHNYYLDFLYNFGLLGFLPFGVLLAYTLLRAWRHRAAILADPALAGVALVTLFILVLDSNMKVTLRQPYSGLFAYFVWGILLSRLLALERGARKR